MSDVKAYFEIGHKAQVRSKQTPEGFTHDWEVFVRGGEGADISHFVDKVVFLLHDTFPKPRRVVKEPPFSIKESGYAGFIIPIEIYLKNKDEPKKIEFSYDFRLERQEGLLKDRSIFKNPNDDFRKKLLKGGGTVSNNEYYDSFTDEKAQLLSKSKLPSESTKKHKSKEHKEDMPYKNSNFVQLFGSPIQKPPKICLDAKKNEKTVSSVKSEKKDKDSTSSDKKSKHEHKEAKSDKVRVKEEKEKIKQEKIKSHSKEQDKPKEKPSKRPSDKPPASPEPVKKKRYSPSRKPSSPSARSNSSSSIKDEYKPKAEMVKPKIEEKPPEIKVEKEKKKKEKKSHDKDKERKEKKEHKKESHKVKDSPKEPPKEVPKEIPKQREIIKEKDPIKELVKEKIKSEKPANKFSIENLKKSPAPEPEERNESHKSKERGDSERKHKHKKKDKKRDESREKHKEERTKEKKHKHDKARGLPPEKMELFERRETPVPKERPIPEPQSPISIDTASQCSSKSGLAKTNIAEDINSGHSDSENSVIAEEEEPRLKIEKTSPEPPKREPSPEPEPEPEVEHVAEPEPTPHRHKEKSKKHKDKSAKREEKRRKRKAAEEEDTETRKLAKTSETAPVNDLECGESSGSTSAETKVQDNGVSSSLGEDAEPGDLSPDYMVQLRGLQQRIMMIKNNEDLERVVNLIAETGRYEVTTQTFDFDLCSLDRSTVQQLIQLVGC